MHKCHLLVAFAAAMLLSCSLQAQNLKPVAAQLQSLRNSGVPFTAAPVFSAAPAPYKPKTTLDSNAQHLRLNMEQLHQLLAVRPEVVTLELPWHGTVLRVDLYQAPVLADGFSVQTSGGERCFYAPGAYYRGMIWNDPNSLAAISFFEGEIIGVISSPLLGNLNLGRFEKTGDRSDYVLYSDRYLPKQPNAECVELDVPGSKPKHNQPVAQPDVTGCVQVFFEADFELYQNKGTVVNTVNYVTGFYNVVATLYTNESVSTTISQVYVWTTDDNYSTSSSSEALDQFVAYRTSFTGDLAHLVSLGGSGLGGIAYLDVLCVPGFNYAFSGINSTYQNFPTYSWTINVVTHEMGHNLSSHHTHWCGWAGGCIDNCGPIAGYPPEGGCAEGPEPVDGGTIMSYCHLTSFGVNFDNGFGPLPGDAIRAAVTAAASCIAASCPSSSCNPPTAITVTSITNVSAIVGWTAVSGATSYNLQYRVSGSSAWTTVNGVSNPHTLNSLSPSTVYEVQIQSVCGGGSSPYRVGVIFKTTASACAEPNALTATSPTTSSIVLNWTENGTATQWQVQYGLQGFSLGAGTTVTVNAKPYTLNGLTGGTIYDYYVRAVCGGSNGNSQWVGPLTFSTSLVNDASSGAITLTVDQACPGSNIYTNFGATTTGGEFNPTTANGGYWATGISNTVWFKFTAPASGTVQITTDISPIGTLDDTQIALYNTASPTTINHLLVSQEDGGLLGDGYNAVAYYCGLTPSTTYYIQVDGWSTATGTFCIEVHETLSLPNPGQTCTTYTQTSVNGNTAPTKWFNIYTKPDAGNIGLPVAAVKTSNNLGTVTVKKIRYTSVQAAPNGVKYMQRYYNITSSQNSGSGTKQVRLFYTDDELDNLKSAANQPSGTADDLNISHYDGANEDCTPNNNTSNGATLISNVTATSIGSSDIFYLEFISPGFSEMGAIFGTTPLPVELLFFNGSAQADRNALQWATALEKDLAAFVLERSPDGQSPWAKIGRVAPKPGTASQKNYTFEDTRPLERSYYRLKISDLDGSEKYTHIVALERPALSGLRTLQPNPTDDLLFAEYQASEESTATFRVIGADGRLLLEQTLELVAGQNILPFDVSGLPAGLYYFAVRGAGGMAFVKK